MPRQIVKRRSAATDLLEHFVFIGEHSEGAARRFLERAEETFQLLATHPEIGRSVEYRSPLLAGIRMFPVKEFANHLVFYRPLRDGIEIVRVIHGARDINAIFES